MPEATDDAAIRTLYQDLLNGWNTRSATAMAQLFIEEAIVIGFDGSEMEGSASIETEMSRIFADHIPGRFVGLVRSVHLLGTDTAVLQAVAGMVVPGERDLKVENNAVQTLTVVRREGRWRIAVYQNTPAAYHGRPERISALTQQLRSALQSRSAEIFEN